MTTLPSLYCQEQQLVMADLSVICWVIAWQDFGDATKATGLAHGARTPHGPCATSSLCQPASKSRDNDSDNDNTRAPRHPRLLSPLHIPLRHLDRTQRHHVILQVRLSLSLHRKLPHPPAQTKPPHSSTSTCANISASLQLLQDARRARNHGRAQERSADPRHAEKRRPVPEYQAGQCRGGG